MLRLVIEDDEGQTTVVPLIRDEITIGRKDGNTIRLTERNISRRHARLHCSGDANEAILLEDLDSYNGVRLNGEKIVGCVNIKPGDAIQIGDYHLSLKLDVPLEVPSENGLEPQSTEPGLDGATVVQKALPQNQLPADQQAHFVALSSNLAGETWYIEHREVTMGRTDENDLVINHRSISRNHAKILVHDQIFTIVDLASSNGVRVNGQPFGSCTLCNGDVIELGQVKLRFVAPGDGYVFDRSEIDDTVPEGPTTLRLVLVAMILVAVSAGTFCLLRERRGDEAPHPAVTQKLSDSEMVALIQEGENYMAAQRWTEARAVFGRVLEVKPDHVAALQGLEKAVAGYEQNQQAIILHNEVTDHRWVEAFATLGKLTDEQKAAIPEEISKIQRGYADALLEQGRAELRQGHFDKLNSVLSQLKQYDFAKSQQAALQADILRDQRQSMAAKEALGSAHRIERQEKEAKSGVNVASSGEGASSEPAKPYEKLPFLNATSDKQTEAALPPAPTASPAEPAPTASPDEEYAKLIEEAKAAVSGGEDHRAIRLFKQASALKPNAMPPYSNLCHLFQKQGRIDAALENCQKWHDLAPSPGLQKTIQKRIDELKAEQ